MGKRDKNLLVQCIDSLADDPYSAGSRKLIGAEIYRVRSGNHRIAYTVRGRKLIVLVLKVANRREFYDRIKDIEKRAKALFEED